ncbi:MAG: PIN domain-containing protein [Endomicrobium sp.]|nr:PIN domain-containing protein [Endomicrobium sp.]
MKKLKIYLDTSVISHLCAPDVPEKMQDTRKVWEDVKKNIYDVLISDVTITEIEHCPEPKRSFMYSALANIEYKEVQHNGETERLADLYCKEGGLPPSSQDDAKHIAVATANSCNAIISWNFKHIVNLRAMTAVDVVNLKEGYVLLRILSPSMLLKEEE